MWDLICDAIRAIANFVKRVIRAVINFFSDIIGWFKQTDLDPRKDTVFIMKGQKFNEMLHKAPNKNVGLFQGVYDNQTDEVRHYRQIDADSLDAETMETFGDDDLVTLS